MKTLLFIIALSLTLVGCKDDKNQKEAKAKNETTIDTVTTKKGITIIEGLTVVAGKTKCARCGKEIKEGERYYIINSEDICSKCFNK